MLIDALGSLATCGQFFVYKLHGWKEERHKYTEKEPYHLTDGYRISNKDPANWSTLQQVIDAVDGYRSLNTDPGTTYTVGMYLTADLGVFCVDIDQLPADYTTHALADEVRSMLPASVMLEWTSSRRGMHLLGRYGGKLPDHAIETGNTTHMAFYTQDRGIAFDPSGSAWGCVDVDCTSMLPALLAKHFPAKDRKAVMPDNSAMLPIDPRHAAVVRDRQLDRIAAAMPGERNEVLNRCCFLLGGYIARDVWPFDEVRNAVWNVTKAAGWADPDKVWRTIEGSLRDGMKEPVTGVVGGGGPIAKLYGTPPPLPAALPAGGEAVTTAVGQLISADMLAKVDELLRQVSAAGTFEEVHNEVIPTIIAAAIPRALGERLVVAVNKKLDFFDAKLPVGQLRTLLMPSGETQTQTVEAGDWVYEHCYITSRDKFYNTLNGEFFTPLAFDRTYAELMPMKPNGRRASASEWATERWGIVRVNDVSYRPDKGMYFQWAAREHVNAFVPSSIPPVETFTAEGVAAIDLFQNHLWLLCGQRQDVFNHLLQWMAHNVQQPGRKIRWSPIIKGVQGDGKSIIGDVLRAALGVRNVRTTSIATLTNSGGFTDWAEGAAVNFIEEIRLVGKAKHDLFNAMKIFIGDTNIDINNKGKVGSGTVRNVTNHIATTNFNDALPLDDQERRWMVIYTPYGNIHEAAAVKGLSIDAMVAQFKVIGDATLAVPGQFRAWLLSVDCSAFKPDARAPWTEEKERMIASAVDTLDDLVADMIETGCVGVTKEVFSSGCLLNFIKIRGATEIPQTSAWSHILGRLGYEKLPKVVWWNGGTHRIWQKNGFKGDPLQVLDKSKSL